MLLNRGRCLISDPLSLKRHSSESNCPTSFLDDFNERSKIFLRKSTYFSVHDYSLVVIIKSANPCKNANREVVPYLRPSTVANGSTIWNLHI